MFVDKDYSVYVVDKSNHRVMKYMRNVKGGIVVTGGNGAGNQTNQLYLPSDLLFDKHGNLYVF